MVRAPSSAHPPPVHASAGPASAPDRDCGRAHADLADNKLTSLPASFGELKALRLCQLAHNSLTSLPRSVGQLGELVDLSLLANRLEKLPSQLGRMTALQSLRVQLNRCGSGVSARRRVTGPARSLHELPASMTALTRLSVLDCGSNRLGASRRRAAGRAQTALTWGRRGAAAVVPAWLDQLPILGQLNLFGNPIGDSAPLPATLGGVASLAQLYLSYCNVSTKWPDGVGARLAPTLHTLHLDGNDMALLPADLAHLTRLGELHVGANRLLALPPWISALQRLGRLHASANHLAVLPTQLFACTVRGRDRVRRRLTRRVRRLRADAARAQRVAQRAHDVAA